MRRDKQLLRARFHIDETEFFRSAEEPGLTGPVEAAGDPASVGADPQKRVVIRLVFQHLKFGQGAGGDGLIES